MLGRPRGPNYRPRNTGRGQARGERVGGAVLTEAIVRRIREIRMSRQNVGRKMTRLVGPDGIAAQLAAEGVRVTPGAVRGVIYGGNWRHVT